MKRIVGLLCIAGISGCASAPSEPRPADYYTLNEAPVAAESAPLFKGDETVIGDDEIRRILDYRYTFPKLSRIAILPLGQRAWWSSWSAEFSVMNAEQEQKFLAALRGSKRIFDASYLPSVIIPGKRTIPYLREAAARYQADLLLMYRTDCKTFEKYRMFSPDETKAYCTVETIVLDTRTGIIPFTSVNTETFEAKLTKSDQNFSETIHKAEIAAIGKALLGAAQNLVAFMDAEAGKP